MVLTPSHALDPVTLDRFRASQRGRVSSPGDADYDQARTVYNAMIDKRPALVARCDDVGDVVAALAFARETDLTVAVRGGGHNGGGLGVVDGGLVVDLSPMRWVHVHPDGSRAEAGGGALLGDLDHATHAFGRAVPAGVVSTTGIAGLTLGGGVGHLTRKYGLTIDNLEAVEMVLADGTVVLADADHHDSLFWAVRGGGGNFGVVTSFRFHLNPVDTVTAGPMLWSLDDAPDVLRFYRDFLPSAPDDLNGFFAFMTVPPAEPFPEELHGRPMCGVVWCSTAAPEAAQALIDPARDAVAPAFDLVGPMPYPTLQGLFDALLPPGLQWYWRGDYVAEIGDAAVETHLDWAARMPTALSTMHLYPTDGAASRVGPHDTAWSYRDARWAAVFGGIDPDPANAGIIRDWTVGYWEAMHPYSMGGSYVNFMMEEGQDRVEATYRDNYERLTEVKATYDPENFFRVNQNIRPAVAPSAAGRPGA